MLVPAWPPYVPSRVPLLEDCFTAVVPELAFALRCPVELLLDDWDDRRERPMAARPLQSAVYHPALFLNKRSCLGRVRSSYMPCVDLLTVDIDLNRLVFLVLYSALVLYFKNTM